MCHATFLPRIHHWIQKIHLSNGFSVTNTPGHGDFLSCAKVFFIAHAGHIRAYIHWLQHSSGWSCHQQSSKGSEGRELSTAIIFKAWSEPIIFKWNISRSYPHSRELRNTQTDLQLPLRASSTRHKSFSINFGPKWTIFSKSFLQGQFFPVNIWNSACLSFLEVS